MTHVDSDTRKYVESSLRPEAKRTLARNGVDIGALNFDPDELELLNWLGTKSSEEVPELPLSDD